MGLPDGWNTAISDLFTQSDFGLLGNLVPLILILGISWALVKKPREIMFIQFPITLAINAIFPFLNNAFLWISLAVFIMSLLGSKGDLLADVKETPKIIREAVVEKYTGAKARLKDIKDKGYEVKSGLKIYK